MHIECKPSPLGALSRYDRASINMTLVSPVSPNGSQLFLISEPAQQ